MENTNPNACGAMEGSLPGKCANLAFPYIPMQGMDSERYDQTQALAAGTLFPGLNLPFFKAVKSRMNCDNTALCELMALGFAITYTDYVNLAKEGRKRYEASYGPLQQTAVTAAGYTWLNNPWPWDLEGGSK